MIPKIEKRVMPAASNIQFASQYVEDGRPMTASSLNERNTLLNKSEFGLTCKHVLSLNCAVGDYSANGKTRNGGQADGYQKRNKHMQKSGWKVFWTIIIIRRCPSLFRGERK